MKRRTDKKLPGNMLRLNILPTFHPLPEDYALAQFLRVEAFHLPRKYSRLKLSVPADTPHILGKGRHKDAILREIVADEIRRRDVDLFHVVGATICRVAFFRRDTEVDHSLEDLPEWVGDLKEYAVATGVAFQSRHQRYSQFWGWRESLRYALGKVQFHANPDELQELALHRDIRRKVWRSFLDQMTPEQALSLRDDKRLSEDLRRTFRDFVMSVAASAPPRCSRTNPADTLPRLEEEGGLMALE